jgi:hypothetical protein
MPAVNDSGGGARRVWRVRRSNGRVRTRVQNRRVLPELMRAAVGIVVPAPVHEHVLPTKRNRRVPSACGGQAPLHLRVRPLVRAHVQHMHPPLAERALRVIAREEEDAVAADRSGGVVGAREGRLAGARQL